MLKKWAAEKAPSSNFKNFHVILGTCNTIQASIDVSKEQKNS